MNYTKDDFRLLMKQNQIMRKTIAKLNDDFNKLCIEIRDDVGSIHLISTDVNKCSVHYKNIEDAFDDHTYWLDSWGNKPKETKEVCQYMINLIHPDIQGLIRDYKKEKGDETRAGGEYLVKKYTKKDPDGISSTLIRRMDSSSYINHCEGVIQRRMKSGLIDELYEIRIHSAKQWGYRDKGIQIWKHPSENVQNIRTFNKI